MLLAETAFSRAALAEAWQVVLANDLADQVPSASVTRFADEAESRLDRLAAELADGSYRARPLTAVVIRAGAKERTLGIPAAADRVVARAVLTAVTDLVDPWLGCASYAYRPGLGVVDAVTALARLRDEGLRWVLRTDVADCFPHLDADLAHRRLAALLPDASLQPTLDQLRHRATVTPDGRVQHPGGIPQGCALSPLLANLVLVGLDEALLAAGFPVVRYADDLTVAAADHADAAEAARVATAYLDGVGMTLNTEKTRITTFEEGFTFLGEDFGPRYPPAASARVDVPDQKVVYVARQGGRVRVSRGRLVAESKNDEELLSVPVSHVARVVLLGSVGLTAGARAWALESGVTVVLASRTGSYQGSLVSHAERWRPDRLRRQLAFTDSDAALALARGIVEAKVTKQRVLLQRYARRDNHDEVAAAVSGLEALLRMLPDAADRAELMGLEGAAARTYFPAYGALFPAELRFTERSRQPPQDLANAALSFLYTVLLGECVTALHAAGLDPGFGILHAEQKRRPSLALDLMEELRPLIVDQVVVEAARTHRLRPEHGTARTPTACGSPRPGGPPSSTRTRSA